VRSGWTSRSPGRPTDGPCGTPTRRRGITGVPTFVIGDRVLTGLQDRETLAAVIEEALAASREGPRDL